MLLDHYGHKVRSENTHWKAKYHCISGLQIDWIGFYRTRKDVFFKMGPSRPHFHYFCLFNIVDSKMFNTIFLTMTGFELWTSGIGSDRSTNWATTTAHENTRKYVIICVYIPSTYSYCIVTQQTGDQPFSDTSPYEVIECSLVKLKKRSLFK